MTTSPYFREDGSALYYASNRIQANQLDIYRASWNGAGFALASAVAELNSPANEFDPVITPDELTIFFISDRAGGRGGLDIWTATRPSTSAPFSAPANLTELNTSADDIPTFVTADACTIYFAFNGPGHYVQYVASRPAM